MVLDTDEDALKAESGAIRTPGIRRAWVTWWCELAGPPPRPGRAGSASLVPQVRVIRRRAAVPGPGHRRPGRRFRGGTGAPPMLRVVAGPKHPAVDQPGRWRHRRGPPHPARRCCRGSRSGTGRSRGECWLRSLCRNVRDRALVGEPPNQGKDCVPRVPGDEARERQKLEQAPSAASLLRAVRPAIHAASVEGSAGALLRWHRLMPQSLASESSPRSTGHRSSSSAAVMVIELSPEGVPAGQHRPAARPPSRQAARPHPAAATDRGATPRARRA